MTAAPYDFAPGCSARLRDALERKRVQHYTELLNSAPEPTATPRTDADSPAGALSTPGGASLDDWQEGCGGDAILDRQVP